VLTGPSLLQTLSNIGFRLHKEKNPDSYVGWELKNWEQGVKLQLNIFKSRENDLKSAYSPLSIDNINLQIISYSRTNDETIVNYALRLIDELSKLNDYNNETEKIVEIWIESLFIDLDSKVTSWIAHNISNLNSKNIEKLISTLNDTVMGTSSEEVLSNYVSFINDINIGVLKEDRLNDHFEHLLETFKDNLQDSEYIKALFPLIVKVIIQKCPPANTGEFLTQVFQGEALEFEILSWLHNQMIDYWPKETPDNNDYSINKIFDTAYTSVINSPSDQNSVRIAISLNSMFKNKIIDDSYLDKLLTAAFLLWPINRIESISTFSVATSFKDPNQVAKLSSAISLDNETESKDLKHAWSIIGEKLTLAEKVTVATLISERSTSEVNSFLHIWLETQPGQMADILKQILINNDTSHSTRLNTWKVAVTKAQSLGSAFFITTLSEYLKLDDSSTNISEIFAFTEYLQAFKTAASKKKLAKVLLDSKKLLSDEDSNPILNEQIIKLGHKKILESDT